MYCRSAPTAASIRSEKVRGSQRRTTSATKRMISSRHGSASTTTASIIAPSRPRRSHDEMLDLPTVLVAHLDIAAQGLAPRGDGDGDGAAQSRMRRLPLGQQ